MRAALALLTGAAMVPVTAASAATRQVTGLHDARYCEIIELKGAPPNATATVWNTIGLNTLPGRPGGAPSTPAALARELGDTVVVLNGPRHFLMDSATAVTGRRRAFHGLRTDEGRDDPDPHRRRPGPDAVHRPHDRAHQHLALEARAAPCSSSSPPAATPT